jgi:peptidoglycan/LPS O-acetylase OafA/YrhL
VRNRYIDLLRAAAIVRVIVYHTLGFWWLTVIFPAMGLMFALGGSLMAASVDRSGVRALGRRLRRILPPVWVLGAIAVSTMYLMGGMEYRWKLLLWLVPFADPPTTPWGAQWLAMIWYIRSYLWFIVLTPALLWVFRRWPIPSLLVPFGVLVWMVASKSDFAVGGTFRDFFFYAPSWMLGFAYHDGMLQKLNRKLVWAISLVLAGAGLFWLFTHRGPRGFDLNDNPIADAMWSTAFLLILLSHAPKAMSLGRADAPVEAVNRRALTIYLWHQGAITLVDFVAAFLGISLLGTWGGFIEVTSVFLVVGVAVLAFGWVEDVAAKRVPMLVPVGSARKLRRSRAPMPDHETIHQTTPVAVEADIQPAAATA